MKPPKIRTRGISLPAHLEDWGERRANQYGVSFSHFVQRLIDLDMQAPDVLWPWEKKDFTKPPTKKAQKT